MKSNEWNLEEFKRLLHLHETYYVMNKNLSQDEHSELVTLGSKYRPIDNTQVLIEKLEDALLVNETLKKLDIK